MLLSRTRTLLLRNIKDSNNHFTRRHSHEGGVPGENLPFGKSLGRPAKMTTLFVLFFGSGLLAPNLVFMYMYLK
ncbi:hypothetical protein NQ315_009554 [Exocentrus adspersus]|uniref:Cytochrome c oxidase polypeptide VIIc n=1 Tax=Exocentrus adspersus TaxID=1586481 RepID=A0AAV8WHC2_9CUCU|nr:hypothetical protein NQ315_009554 [Exocentrus adspersus]